MRIKRETGASPVQSRCCKLLKMSLVHSKSHCSYANGKEVRGRVSQKTCKTSQLLILPSRRGTGHCFISTFSPMPAHCIKKACYAVLFAVSLPLCKIFAQSDNGVHLLDTLVVSSHRATGIESAAPVQSLSAEAIGRLGATNVGEALKYFSGVTIKDYGGIGGLKSVSIRGMGAQHTAVFYDGVAVGDCQNGQVDVGRFSTDNIANIQMLIGQGDDIYQSARTLAAAGTVSIETNLQQKNSFKIGARAASFDSYQANVHIGRRLGSRLYTSLFGDYTNAGGCYKFNIDGAGSSIAGRRRNSDIESARAEANIIWSDARRHTLRAKLYGYSSMRGVPGAVIVDNPLSSERLLSRNIFGQLFYEYTPSAHLKMKATLKHNYTYDKNRLPATAGGASTHKFHQNETDLSYTIKWQINEHFSVALAEEIIYNTLRTDNRHNVMSASPNRITNLAALSARYSSSIFCATGSLLHSLTDEWSSVGKVAPQRSRLSPSLSVALYPLQERLCLRASYRDIFRLPTFNDLYYRESGNFALRPEKSRMLNVGAAYSLPRYGILSSLTLSVDGYCGRISDKIVAVPGIFVWKMSNVDKVSLTGADANINARIELQKGTHINLSAAYSYMHAVDDTDGSPVKGEQIIYTPRHSGSGSAALQTPFIDAGYTLVWSSERYRLAQNIPSTRVDGYCDHSLWMSHCWQAHSATLTLRVEAMNLCNKNYEIIRYYPMPGRSFRLSATINL